MCSPSSPPGPPGLSRTSSGCTSPRPRSRCACSPPPARRTRALARPLGPPMTLQWGSPTLLSLLPPLIPPHRNLPPRRPCSRPPPRTFSTTRRAPWTPTSPRSAGSSASSASKPRSADRPETTRPPPPLAAAPFPTASPSLHPAPPAHNPRPPPPAAGRGWRRSSGRSSSLTRSRQRSSRRARRSRPRPTPCRGWRPAAWRSAGRSRSELCAGGRTPLRRRAGGPPAPRDGALRGAVGVGSTSELAYRARLTVRLSVPPVRPQEKHQLADVVGVRLEAWQKMGKGNIRAYLTTVQARAHAESERVRESAAAPHATAAPPSPPSPRACRVLLRLSGEQGWLAHAPLRRGAAASSAHPAGCPLGGEHVEAHHPHGPREHGPGQESVEQGASPPPARPPARENAGCATREPVRAAGRPRGV